MNKQVKNWVDRCLAWSACGIPGRVKKSCQGPVKGQGSVSLCHAGEDAPCETSAVAKVILASSLSRLRQCNKGSRGCLAVELFLNPNSLIWFPFFQFRILFQQCLLLAGFYQVMCDDFLRNTKLWHLGIHWYLHGSIAVCWVFHDLCTSFGVDSQKVFRPFRSCLLSSCFGAQFPLLLVMQPCCSKCGSLPDDFVQNEHLHCSILKAMYLVWKL